MSEKKLTTKQKLFIEAYLANPNATEAARIAGYKGSAKQLGVVGAQNLAKLSISETVKEKVESFGMTANDVLKGIAEIAQTDLQTLQINPAYKAGDKLKALELLGKHFKLFTEKIESDSKVKIEVEFVNE